MRSKLLGPVIALLVGVGIISCSDLITNSTSPMRKARGAAFDTDPNPTPRVRISQVYGGGGNSGAPLNEDFVELYNAGTAPQDLTGWSVQYASATGTGALGNGSSQLVALSGTINPGQYYLVALASGSNGGPLPAADATGTINMSGSSGKVALADIATSLGCNTAATCTGVTSHIIDLVGYGSANYFEGSDASPGLSNSSSAIRNDPCIDTDDNAADFTTSSPPNPRNSTTTTAVCEGGSGPVIGPLDHVVISGNAPVAVGGTITLSADLQDAANHSISDPAAIFTWSSDDESIARVSASSANMATITGVANGQANISVQATSGGVTATQQVAVTVTGGANNGPVTSNTIFVSEIHYDNVGTDANETIEIESPAGETLDGYKLALYDGTSGLTYPAGAAPITLTGLPTTICGNGRQVTVISFPSNGIQNGSQDGVTPTVPDGWAIIDPTGKPIEFMSYEGTFVAASGPAANYLSTDIGKNEGSSTSATQSLQRAGNGEWFGPSANTFGACNPAVPVAPQSIIIQDRPTALPVGFQDQFFIDSRSKDGQGNPVGNADVTWSSSDPTIVSIDPNTGIVTGLKAGQVTITATAKSDQSIGTATVTAAVLPTSPTARVGHNTELGTPTDANPNDEFLIARRQYTLSYNPAHGGPNWVSWNLDASHKGTAPRCDCFSADPEVAAHNVPAYNTNDWINGGVWSRGHMAPSADWNVSDGDNAPTFYLSNMLPQNQTLNSGAWGDLENHLRDVAVGSTEIYIIAGGIFTRGRTNGDDGLGFMNSTGRILVPDSVWKIAVIVPDGRAATGITTPSDVQVIAAKFPNSAAGTGSFTNYLSTIDAIQKSTGYDFLSSLPENIQCALESRDCAPIAAIVGPTGGSEGDALTFDGSQSSDPDGESLSYQWSVNGSVAGIQPTLTHTFAQNGEYDVTLVVADPHGASSTKTVTVSIANVAPVVTFKAITSRSVESGDIVAVSGSFTDPGPDAPWRSSIDWGDGHTTPTLPSKLVRSGERFLGGTQYKRLGTFTATLTVVDNDGGAGTSALTYTVSRRVIRGSVDQRVIRLSHAGGDRITVTLVRDLIANMDDLDVASVKIGSVGVSRKHNGQFDYKVRNHGSEVELTFSKQALMNAGLLTSSTTELTLIGSLTNGIQIISHLSTSTSS
jgi:DNA/RNA endonuclease G (NUC1)